MQEDQRLADACFDYAWRLVKHWLSIMMYSSMGIPEIFVLLLSDDEAIVAQRLKSLGQWHEWMRKGEGLAHSDRDVAGILRTWLRPQMQWVREQLVSLSEYSFKAVPPDVKDACAAKFNSFGQTVIIEDTMQVFEAVGHETKNRAISRKARWRRLRLCDL